MSVDKSTLVVALCNCSPTESHALARALVEERLAACVNVIEGVRSYYEWEGDLRVESENTLVIKTTTVRWDALRARIAGLHSYTNPEIVALPTTDAAKPYLEWVRAQTEPS